MGSFHSQSATLSFPVSTSMEEQHDSILSRALVKFWETEEAETPTLSRVLEDKICEDIFLSTTTKDEAGRYVVSLPFKETHPKLGDSLAIAVKRFHSLEKRMERSVETREFYEKYFRDHLKCGVMEKIPTHQLSLPASKHFYMPYTDVIKASSTTTKIRTVYDCSSRTVDGPSLNEIIHTGPKVMVDLIPLLIRFRTYPIAISADIEKFFNQFPISESHKDFHRLVYRSSPHLILTHYRMKRLTFGVTCSPFLATRCLWKIFEDHSEDEQLLRVIKEDVLVDNLLSGAFSILEALALQQQLIQIMKIGKLNLRKWASNVPELISSVPPEDRECQLPLTISEDSGLHTLGLKWDPGSDALTVIIHHYEIEKEGENISKRMVLSKVAKLYDPLGWLSPVSIRSKILLQELWKEGFDWDAPLSIKLRKKWNHYSQDLKSLQMFRLPRCFIPPSFLSPDTLSPRYQLLGFSDASNDAYAAVAYIRVINSAGQTFVSLVGAKTKVAPIKGETTPRSELNGAKLLSTFLKTIIVSSRLNFEIIVCYTDSTSVLGWMTQQSRRLSRNEIFILNRIKIIQNNLPKALWKHVSGTENPADMASRGIKSSDFLNNPLWLHGPPWLSTIQYSEENIESSMARMNLPSLLLTKIVMRYSRLTRMTRVMAYILRFARNCKSKDTRSGPLSSDELESSLLSIVRIVQSEGFPNEQRLLLKGLPLSSSLKFLSPFVDDSGLIRVGGRLSNADAKIEKKHPLLLPKSHHFYATLFQSFHIRHLHAGPTLLLTLVREKFWVPSGPTLAKRTVKKCIICHRQVARPLTQFMADLPKPRVSVSRPFSHVGMDFSGPFSLAVTIGRKPRLTKSYLCVFVCMATKAVHLEVVCDLSTPAFLATLRRFVSRRGRPLQMYSDGGKNFVGAKNELDRLVAFLNSEEMREGSGAFYSENGIKFNLNPPLSPHHGGLFEAVVKSTKHHLKRVMEDRHLTHEEFGTLLCEIEAVLNSRPLTPLSSDPSDFEALTPAHFIIGGSLMAVPQKDISNNKENGLTRWKRNQQLYQHFWKRFSTEYLQTLQSRPKWLENQPDVEPGVLVLVQKSTQTLQPTNGISLE